MALDCGLEPDCYLTAGATTPPGDPFGGCFFGQFSWDFAGTEVDWGLQVTNDQKTIIFGRMVDTGFPQRYDTAKKVSRNAGDWSCTPGDWYAPECTPVVTQPRPAMLPPAPPGTIVPPGVYAEPNPNLEREWKRGTGTPASEPGFPAPAPSPEIMPEFRIEITATPRPGLGTIAGAQPRTGSPEPQLEAVPQVAFQPGTVKSPPAPPKPKEKEKKVVAKGRAIAIAAFRILDGLSEIGDMVEALYAALPKKVRRAFEKEERARRGLPPGASLERPGDQMGQYGVNGMDWRLRALWRHWDQLDAPEAVRNLIANEVEDRAYGRYYAARDRLLNRGKDRPRSHYRNRPI